MENSGTTESVDRSARMIEKTIARFLDTAGASAVFGKPVPQGETTIIPAAEVVALLGFGTGSGSGGEEGNEAKRAGGGSGGGGGGKTFSRAVAVIVASPDGVRVEPVVDVTKVALAAITAGGFMIAAWFGFVRPGSLLDHLRK